MIRTQNRPLPQNRINPQDALHFGIFLAIFSVILLGLASNFLSAFLLAVSIIFYIVIYTIWLKKITPQNIVIGGAAGAIPPIIGWTVVENNITLFPIFLFLIIFLWTPPHFWSLALFCDEDYKKANIPMMPSIKGVKRTKLYIVQYSFLVVLSSILPFLFKYTGLLYMIISCILGYILIKRSITLLKQEDSKPLFRYSILYLFLIFSAMIVEKLISV